MNEPSARYSAALTCWKEIAAYVGKSVRTVQRWEKELDFPIRRPTCDYNTVFAIPAEIDDWMTGLKSSSTIRQELIRAQEEILRLQRKLAEYRARVPGRVCPVCGSTSMAQEGGRDRQRYADSQVRQSIQSDQRNM